MTSDGIKKNWHFIFPIFLGICACADLTTTLIIKNISPAFIEANPIMAFFLNNYGDFWTAIFKLTTTILVCFCVWWLLIQNDRKITIFITIMGLFINLCLFLIWLIWIIIYL